MQMSPLDSYQYSNNTTILCIWAWERCSRSLWKWLQKNNEKETKRYLTDVQFCTDKKLAITQDSTLQNSDEKQYCQHWILRLVVFTRFRANSVCLLKLCMLVKSARKVFSWALLGKTCQHPAYFIWLAEGIATILCCCAKRVSMLFTIGLWQGRP